MRFCLRPHCSQLVERGYCATHAPNREAQRPNPDVRAWYHSPRWRQWRAAVLRAHPICSGYGARIPCGQPATDVDHREPHHGDPRLFWNWRNLQALCTRCHASKTGHGQ